MTNARHPPSRLRGRVQVARLAFILAPPAVTACASTCGETIVESGAGIGDAAVPGSGGGTGTGGAVGRRTGGASAGVDSGPGGHTSAGCGLAARGTSNYIRSTITLAGAEREYFIYVPRTYAKNRAYPIVFRWPVRF